jgi:hypothetical protein
MLHSTTEALHRQHRQALPLEDEAAPILNTSSAVLRLNEPLEEALPYSLLWEWHEVLTFARIDPTAQIGSAKLDGVSPAPLRALLPRDEAGQERRFSHAEPL